MLAHYRRNSDTEVLFWKKVIQKGKKNREEECKTEYSQPDIEIEEETTPEPSFGPSSPLKHIFLTPGEDFDTHVPSDHILTPLSQIFEEVEERMNYDMFDILMFQWGARTETDNNDRELKYQNLITQSRPVISNPLKPSRTVASKKHATLSPPLSPS